MVARSGDEAKGLDTEAVVSALRRAGSRPFRGSVLGVLLVHIAVKTISTGKSFGVLCS